MDTDVLAYLTGKRFARNRLIDAALGGYPCVQVRSRPYPILVPVESGRGNGTLIQNVNRNEASRLNHYERSYAAEMLEMALELGAKEVAHMFMPRNLSVAIDRNWNFDI